MRILFAVLAALLAAPTASACSWAQVALLEHPAWHGGTLHVATGLFWRGPVDLDAGTATPTHPSESVLAPSGDAFVFPRAGPDVQTGPMRVVDSCGLYASRHLVVSENGTFRMLDEGPVWGIGGDGSEVHALGADEARVYAWPELRLLREEPTRGRVEAFHWSGLIEAGRPALPPTDGTALTAWSPDGTHAARARFVAGETGELAIVRASDGAILARANVSAPYAGRLDLDWGAGGLAVAQSERGEVTVYRDPLALERPTQLRWDNATSLYVAWAPDGRLAVTMPANETAGRLVILDADITPTLDRAVTRAPFDEAAWWANVAAHVPEPEYGALTKLRELPAPTWGALVLGALAAISLPSRGTSREPRR